MPTFASNAGNRNEATRAAIGGCRTSEGFLNRAWVPVASTSPGTGVPAMVDTRALAVRFCASAQASTVTTIASRRLNSIL
eukprot:1613021-Rhodomonas_salina.1